MSNCMVLMAVMFFMAAIIVGLFTENNWRNTAITWGLLSVGAVLFGLVLTL